MSKSSKRKKSKVPKLTEAEYAAYVSSLKSSEEPPRLMSGGEGIANSAEMRTDTNQ